MDLSSCATLAAAVSRSPAIHPIEYAFGAHRQHAKGYAAKSVTEAASKLQKLGVIRYSRGQITVLDRSQLEQLCCECYAVVKRETDRLLPRVDG